MPATQSRTRRKPPNTPFDTPVDTSPSSDPSEGAPDEMEGWEQLTAEQKDRLNRRKLPPFPKGMTFGELTGIWTKLNEDQRSHLMIYLYRLEPIINRKVKDPKAVNYIDVLGSDQQMSMDYMIATHGGGKYQFIVNDTDIRKTLSQFTLTINTAQFDPILNLEELNVWEKSNDAYVAQLQVKGRLDSERRVITNPTAHAQKGDAMGNAIAEKIVDAYLTDKAKPPIAPPPSSGSEVTVAVKYMDIMAEKMKENNPLSMFGVMMEMVKTLTSQPKPQDNTLDYIKMMENQRMENQKLIESIRSEAAKEKAESDKRLFDLLSKPKETPNLTEEIEKIKALAEVMGLGGSGGRVHWSERVIDALSGPLTAVAPVLANVALQAMNKPKPGEQTPNPGIPRMPSEMGQPPTAGPIITEIPTTATVVENGEQVGPDPLDLIIEQYGTMLVGYIGNGKSGYDIAEQLIETGVLPRPVYMMICKDGKDGILNKMKLKTPFWNQLMQFGESRVTDFITDFVGYGVPNYVPTDAGDEDDEEDI